jgi:putative ABC transport system permease protein
LTLQTDLRHAFFSLLAARGFVVGVVVALGLGIGVNVSMFSVANDVLLRPAPFVRNPAELVTVCRVSDDDRCDGWSYPDYSDMLDRINAFSGLLAYRDVPVNLRSGTATERVTVLLVSDNYFALLGVPIVYGRSFESGQPGTGPPVVVVSARFGERRFGSAANAVGRTILLNSATFTVAGVAQPRFYGTELGPQYDIWVPLSFEDQARVLFPSLRGRLFRSMAVVGRLAGGATVELANAQLAALSPYLQEAGPRIPRFRAIAGSGIRVNPAWRRLFRDYLLLLLAASGLVLVIACANVANLVLTRVLGRWRELATRSALGASRLQLTRSFVVEGVILGVLSGAFGVLFSQWFLRVTPVPLEGLDLTPDLRVAAFTVGIVFAITVLFGAVPAFVMTAGHLVAALKDGGSQASRGSKLRNALAVCQIALSFLLMVGAALFVGTLQRLQRVSPGFNPSSVVEASIDLRLQGYPNARGRILQRQVIERLRADSRITSAALARTAPLGWNWRTRILIPGQETAPGREALDVLSNSVGPGFFETLGIPVVAGRDFTDQDGESSQPVAVVNQSMVRKYWPEGNPLGRQFRLWDGLGQRPGAFATIVGVVKDAKYRDLADDDVPYLYRPLFQDYDATFVVLARGPASTLNAIRQQVESLDPDLTLYDTQTLTQRVAESMGDSRLNAALIASLGTLATVLASIGLYSVLSFAVGQRLREFGIRIALGASAGEIRRLVFLRALRLLVAGVALGLVSVLTLGRFATAYLYGVSPSDPGMIFIAVSVLGVITVLAAALPAERAVRADVTSVLRCE